MKITGLTVFVPGGGREQFADSETTKVTVDEERGIARIEAKTYRRVFVGLPLEIVYDISPLMDRLAI
jgi:hypothetical protein